MYSKNDYRYYLENQLIRSDDHLAHYGVKGMKWKQHKKTTEPVDFTIMRGTDLTTSIAGRARPQSYFIARNNMLDAQTKGKRLTAKTKAQPTIKADQDRGRKRTESLKKTVDYDYKDTRTVTPKKRKTLKGRVANIRRKYGLYREKPKGKSIGGGITVTHDVKVHDKIVPDKIEYDKKVRGR